MTFEQLGLHDSLLRAVRDEGYDTPTPIQLQAIPHVLTGCDLMGCAQTGTGKTAAFALPILHRLLQQPRNGSKPVIRTLILAPTRELTAQIGESFHCYGRHTGFRSVVIFGGVGQKPQVSALINGVDIVIATPGRLLDLMSQGFVDLKNLQQLILDEADNMLDMGFIHDIRKIIARVPKVRQTLMFSATFPKEIRELANTILKNPVSVKVAPEATTAETVQQSIYFVEKPQKPAMLVHYLQHNAIERVLVFSRTKHGADKIAKYLLRSGIRAEAIHGNKSQNARLRAMKNFKSDAPPVLIATDIAARGLDIDNVSHVINYELPNVPETYVHRIGRTGRAGASGIAISFCDSEEKAYLRDIEKLTRIRVPVCTTPADLPKPPAHPTHDVRPEPRQNAPHHEPAAQAQQSHKQPFHAKHQGQSQGQQRRHPRGPNGMPQPHATQSRPAQPHSKPVHKPHQQHHQQPQAPKPASHPIHGVRQQGGSQGQQRHSGPASAHRHGGFQQHHNSGRPSGKRRYFG